VHVTREGRLGPTYTTHTTHTTHTNGASDRAGASTPTVKAGAAGQQKAWLHYGRPNLSEEITKLSALGMGSKALVYGCGPQVLLDSLALLTMELGVGYRAEGF
jgi:hypothetical protein